MGADGKHGYQAVSPPPIHQSYAAEVRRMAKHYRDILAHEYRR